MDVVGIGVSERDIVRQASDLHRVRAVPDEFIGHHDGPVQAQSLSCKGRAEDTAPTLPHRARDHANRRIESPGGSWGTHRCHDDRGPAVGLHRHVPPSCFTSACPIYCLPLHCWSPLVSRSLTWRLVHGPSTSAQCRAHPLPCLYHAPSEPSAVPVTGAAPAWEDEAGQMRGIYPSLLGSLRQFGGSLGCGDHIQHAAFSSPQEPCAAGTALAPFLNSFFPLASTTSYGSKI